jgi:hypothetical protein
MSFSLHRAMLNGLVTLGTWPAFGILMLLCFLFFGYLVPKIKGPIFANVATALPHKVLDEYFPTWTPQIAESFFAAIGADGRAAYRRFYLIMDFWFPGAIASLTIASLMLIAFPATSGWTWLAVLAVPSWLFDVAENVTHFRMAGRYTKLSALALKVGPLFTGAKWISALVPLPVALLGLALHLFSWR